MTTQTFATLSGGLAGKQNGRLPGSGHFPHLAHPAKFAQHLAATAGQEAAA